MLSLYYIPYGIVVSGVVTNNWIYWLLWVCMGVGMAGIGLSIMHDANHGSYSKNKVVNRLFGITLNLMEEVLKTGVFNTTDYIIRLPMFMKWIQM